jgi:membrane fusion protein (multidrug efflux system)
LGRYEALYKTGGITASQLDQYAAIARATAAALKAAQRRIAVAQAQAAEANAGVKTAEDMVRVAESQVKEAQAMAGEAQGRFAGVDIAEERLAGAEAQKTLASADVERLRAEVAQAELDLSYTRICAAQAGTVTKKSVEVGDYVRPGQAILGIVADEKWVVANFKESQLQHMKLGQPVSIRVDAYPGVALSGHVDSVQKGTGARFSMLPSENATGNYVKVVQRVPVKIVFDGPLPPDCPLSLGMSVVPEVEVK